MPEKPVMHGRDHRRGGYDPAPFDVPWARLYNDGSPVSDQPVAPALANDVTGYIPYLGNSWFETNAPEIFGLTGDTDSGFRITTVQGVYVATSSISQYDETFLDGTVAVMTVSGPSLTSLPDFAPWNGTASNGSNSWQRSAYSLGETTGQYDSDSMPTLFDLMVLEISGDNNVVTTYAQRGSGTTGAVRIMASLNVIALTEDDGSVTSSYQAWPS